MYENDDRKQEQSGSGFVNLETMLGLNEQQGQDMAQRVTSDAQGKLDAANTSLGQGEMKNRADSAQAAQSGSTGAGAYSGPKSFGDSAPDVRSQVAAAKQAIGGLGTATGNAQAMSSTYGKGQNYSAAQKGFDAALAGGGINQQAAGLKSSLGDLEGRLGLAEKEADDRGVASRQQYTSNLNDFYAKQAADAEQAKVEQEAADAAAREAEYQRSRWYGLDRDPAKDKRIRDSSRGFGGWR